MSKKEIQELARKYANSFLPCFTLDSSSNFIRMFGAKRFQNTLMDSEISDEDRENKSLQKVFVDEFESQVKDLVKKQSVKIDKKTGKKVHQVKRKKD